MNGLEKVSSLGSFSLSSDVTKIWDLVPPERNSLKKLKRLSIRSKSWFSMLSWAQRRLIDAIIVVTKRIRSLLMLRILAPLVRKLLVAIGGNATNGALSLMTEGAYKFGIYDDREGSVTKGQLDTPVLTSEKLQMLRVPGFYWHGSKVVSSEPALLLYFVTRLYEYKNPDEERRPWDDPTILDPKTRKPFDWNQPPHK